jgi:hypothetical protein
LFTLGGWSADAGPGVGSENGIVGGIGIFAHAAQRQYAGPRQQVVGAPLTQLHNKKPRSFAPAKGLDSAYPYPRNPCHQGLSLDRQGTNRGSTNTTGFDGSA